MAEATFKGQKGKWRTIMNNKVFIRDGQSLSEAMKDSGVTKHLSNRPGKAGDNPKSSYSAKVKEPFEKAKAEYKKKKERANENEYDKARRELKEEKEAEAAKAKEIEAKKDKLKPKEQTPEQRQTAKEFDEAVAEYATFEQFIESQSTAQLIDNMINHKVLKSDDMASEAEQMFNKKRTEFKDKAYKLDDRYIKVMDNDTIVDTITAGIPKSDRVGWYSNEENISKQRIETAVLQDPELRVAGLNITHQNYNALNETNLTFKEFLDKDITVYRGGKVNFRTDDVFAYSMRKEVAEGFAKTHGLEGQLDEVTLKGREMLGTFNQNLQGEAEVFIRRGRKQYE